MEGHRGKTSAIQSPPLCDSASRLAGTANPEMQRIEPGESHGATLPRIRAGGTAELREADSGSGCLGCRHQLTAQFLLPDHTDVDRT